MKIVINAASAKMGGAASYIHGLLEYLSGHARGVKFLVFLPPETAARIKHLGRNIRLLNVEIGHAGLLRRLWWEQVTLRRFLKKRQADVLFSTANFAMFFCPVRQLLLVRNALYFSNLYQEMFLPRHSLRYRLAFALRRWLIVYSARAADVVMTPTEAMLDELRRHVKVKDGIVNPYGVAVQKPRQKEPAAGRADGAEGRVIRLLFVSLYSEHKNLATLLRALAILNGRGGIRFKLKTTADPAWDKAVVTVTYKADMELARAPGIRAHVEFVTPVSQRHLQELYTTSDVFIFPSLVESFGYPMAEAMSYGLPVVAAGTPVNREMCGEAAVYFSPVSAEDLAERVMGLANDAMLRRALGAGGVRRAATRFSWGGHVRPLVEQAGVFTTRGFGPSSVDLLQPEKLRLP